MWPSCAAARVDLGYRLPTEMPPSLTSSSSFRATTITAVLASAAMVLAACSAAEGGVAEAGTPGTEAQALTTTTAAASPTTPSTTEPAATESGPVCVVVAEPGDSLSAIAARSGITVEQLLKENLLDPSAVFHPGQEFDVCIDDGIDLADPTLFEPSPDAVMRQQTELNELLAFTSIPALAVDGDAGRLTRQALCAARMGLGLEVHNRNLVVGSDEEAAIFAATELGIPEGAPTDAAKWILVDQTCQVIFTGEGDDRVVGVFPTSTGEEGHETFNIRARAFRFDPAVDNEGWHDSSSFPVEVDNPLNGNMYKPLYFNDGQAIHGAEFIPPWPRSKGCARTFPKHQDMIIEWLGLQDLTDATWNVREIGVTVLVRGRYVDLPELP